MCHFTGYAASPIVGEARNADKQGRVPIVGSGMLYEDSCRIRGYEQILMGIVDRPEWFKYISDRLQVGNLVIVCVAGKVVTGGNFGRSISTW